jgi:hypothetical protein
MSNENHTGHHVAGFAAMIIAARPGQLPKG